MEKYNYLALLQGINVGGKNTIKMNDLKKLFEDLGFTDIKTYIQSGNVLFKDSEKDKLKLTKKIEKALLDNTKNRILVAILTLSDIKEALKDLPNGFGDENEKYKYDILFLIEPLTPKEIMGKIKIVESEDKIYEGKKVLYVKRIAEKLTGSYISKIVRIWSNVTVRNLNTTKKIYELMLDEKDNNKQ